MSLSEVQMPSETITYRGTEIPLTPLNLAGLMVILQAHRGSSGPQISQMALQLDPTNVHQLWFFATVLVAECTPLVADLIACSAGEPEAAEVAARLPVVLQIRALATIIRLTLEDTDLPSLIRELASLTDPAFALLKQTQH